MNAMTAERAPAITVALPLTDERSTLVAVRRLLVAGALAVSLAGMSLTVAWVCPPDAPWWLMRCW